MNTVGLLLDILGVVLLFIYGLPAGKLLRHIRLTESLANTTVPNLQFWSRLALACIIAGFIVQIVSNHIPQEIGCMPT